MPNLRPLPPRSAPTPDAAPDRALLRRIAAKPDGYASRSEGVYAKGRVLVRQGLAVWARNSAYQMRLYVTPAGAAIAAEET